MALFQFTQNAILPVPATSFAEKGLRERDDLQRLLRDQIEVICPGVLVLSEEFSDWDDSNRRIDLLGLDRAANLVVIELKRTEDGGHMELQAVRYAAMISTMTFDQAVTTHAAYLKARGSEVDAQAQILNHLGWREPLHEQFGKDVKIVLVSANFSKEVTSTVLWLNERDLDIRCVRMKPYHFGGEVLVDIEQIVPLPEAAEHQIKIKEKMQAERSSRNSGKSLAEIWSELEAHCVPEDILVARSLVDWLEVNVTSIFPLSNGIGHYLLANGRKQYFFRINTDGSLDLWFYDLAKRPPFSSLALRAEFLQRLNQIPGIAIPEAKVSGSVRLPLASLRNSQAMVQFRECLRWALSVCNEAVQATQA